MKRKSLFTSLIAVLLILALAAGCSTGAPEASPTAEATISLAPELTPEATPTPPVEEPGTAALNVATLKGPTGMGMVHMMDQAEQGLTKNDYAFTIAGAPDEVTGKLITGEIDIAALPINLAATLYNKTEGDILLIAVNTLGVLYILEDGDSVNSVADLAGKTLYATGEASTPEYILNYLLEKNGVQDKVTVEYKAEHAELASLLAAGEVKLGMLPEPNVTATMLKNDKLRIALNLTEEWHKISDGMPLIQGCIVAQRELIIDRPEAVITFLEEYAESTTFTIANMDEAAALIEKYEIVGSAAAAKKAIPQCNIVCITGEDMLVGASSMLHILYEANPASVGGAMPDSDFYHVFNAG